MEIQMGNISCFCVPNRMRSPLNVKIWEIVYLILNYTISRARINWGRSVVYRASWRCEERRFNQQYSTHHTLYRFVRFRFCLVIQKALQIDTVHSETQTKCKSSALLSCQCSTVLELEHRSSLLFGSETLSPTSGILRISVINSKAGGCKAQRYLLLAISFEMERAMTREPERCIIISGISYLSPLV